jgi:WD40 repeat protein
MTDPDAQSRRLRSATIAAAQAAAHANPLRDSLSHPLLATAAATAAAAAAAATAASSAFSADTLAPFSSPLHTEADSVIAWYRARPPLEQEDILRSLHAITSRTVLARVLGNSADGVDFLSRLPFDVAVRILDLADDAAVVCACACVSKTWRRVAYDLELWYRMCLRRNWIYPGERLPAESGPSVTVQQAFDRLWFGVPTGDVADARAEALRAIRSVNWRDRFRTLFLQQRHFLHNWHSATFRMYRVPVHTSDVLALRVEGTRLVTASTDQSVKVRLLQVLSSACSSSSCGRLCVGVQVWDMERNVCIGTLTGHHGGVSSVAFDNRFILTGSYDRSLRLWDARSGRCVRSFTGHGREVSGCALGHRVLVSSSWDRTAAVWDIAGGRCLRTLRGHDASVNAVWSDEIRAITVSGDATVRLWAVETGQSVLTMSGHLNAITSVHADGPALIATGSYDTNVGIFDVRTGRMEVSLVGHAAEVSGVQLDVQNNRVVSVAVDGSVRAWSLANHAAFMELRHTAPLHCVHFNNSQLFAGAADASVLLWDFGVSDGT